MTGAAILLGVIALLLGGLAWYMYHLACGLDRSLDTAILANCDLAVENENLKRDLEELEEKYEAGEKGNRELEESLQQEILEKHDEFEGHVQSLLAGARQDANRIESLLEHAHEHQGICLPDYHTMRMQAGMVKVSAGTYDWKDEMPDG